MKRYELHLHTYYSPCSNLKPETILKQAKKKKLDGIAITDHNTIKGALKTKALNKDKKLEIIIGEEIKTDKGEILAYYLKKEIKPGKFEKVIKEIKAQKAIAILAHPYSTAGIFRSKSNLNQSQLKQLDGIEVINGRNLRKKENEKALNLANKLNLAKISGSDAHFKEEIGKCPTLIKTNLRKELNATKPTGNNKSALRFRIISGIIKIKSKLFDF